jgi:hypothetical protein
VVNNSPVGSALAKASTGLAVANSVLSATGGIGGLATAASAVGGNLLGGAKNLLSGAVGKASGLAAGALGDLKAGGAGMLAQLESQFAGIQTGAGSIKAAAAAVGTFDKTAIIAKTGQLLGDPKIPTPTSVFRDDALPDADLTQQTAEVAAAMNAVEEAGYRVNAAKINLSITTKTSRGVPGGDARIAEAAEGLAKEEAALQVAQNAYTAAVSA